MNESIKGAGDVAADQKRSWSRPSHVRYGVLAFACALAVVTYVQRLGFSAGLPEIADSLSLDANRVADLGSAFLLAYGLFQVPGGLLCVGGAARLVRAGLVFSGSLLTAGVVRAVLLPRGWMLPFLFLVVMRFLFGAFQAGGFPVIGRILADWMPVAERGFA